MIPYSSLITPARLGKPGKPCSGGFPVHVERITLWLEVVTGMELDPDSGEIRVLEAATWHERRGRLRQLGGAPGARP